MKLPFAVPSETFYGALTYLGIAAVIYAVVVPTDQYDTYQHELRDLEEEKAVLSVELEYLQKHKDRLDNAERAPETWHAMLEAEKQLAIRKVKLSVSERRVDDSKRNWEKSRIWSLIVGGGGVIISLVGFSLWRRRELNKDKQQE